MIRFFRATLIVVCMIAGGMVMAAYGVMWVMHLFGAPSSWHSEFNVPYVRLSLTAAGVVLGAVIGAEVTSFLAYVGRRIEDMDYDDKLNAVIGVPIALLISVPFYQFLIKIDYLGPVLAVLLTLVAVFLVITGVGSIREGLPWSSQPAGRKRNIRILDTNVIIDGRIGEVIKTGFLGGQIYIPGFVLDELQAIADSADALKRARGRRGLDILNSIQKERSVEVRTQDRLAPEAGDGVDARLVRLAKAMNCDIVTNDYNLSKVASLQGVDVLNVNDLALAMKPNVLPGEVLTVAVMREGKEPGQGVGYLDDGTMVVVEGGHSDIGNTIDVNVTSVIQTVAGKMIFSAPLREYEGGAQDVRSISSRRHRR